MTTVLRLLIATCIALLPTAALAEDLAGTWLLGVKDTKGQEVASLRIRFTQAEAPSCMGGDWKRVFVVSGKAAAKPLFPASESLSYRLEGADLTIGRNELCDAYLHLHGRLSNGAASGPYVRFGWGSETIGSFMLKRLP